MVKEVGIKDEYEAQTDLDEVSDVLRRKGISVTYSRQTMRQYLILLTN